MEWYKKIDDYSSEERIILSLLTMGEDPTRIWMGYMDAFSMSTLDQGRFNLAVRSLLNKSIIRMGDQGKGVSLALEEKIFTMKEDRLNKVILEIEDEIKEALIKGDDSLVKDLQEILRDINDKNN